MLPDLLALQVLQALKASTGSRGPLVQPVPKAYRVSPALQGQLVPQGLLAPPAQQAQLVPLVPQAQLVLQVLPGTNDCLLVNL